jgi:hypothetical protein
VVLQKQETAPESLLGAAVYTGARQLAGFVFEVCEECYGIALSGGMVIWLGKPMIAAVEGRSVFLVSNLLRKHHSLHTGIHIHRETETGQDATERGQGYLDSQAT